MISDAVSDDPCKELKEKYEELLKVAQLASAPATHSSIPATLPEVANGVEAPAPVEENKDLPAPGLIGQSGGYIKLNIDGEDYYLLKKYNSPLNLTGGENPVPIAKESPQDMDELLYKKKYEKYRAKYLALKKH